jgi:hypothetical protein
MRALCTSASIGRGGSLGILYPEDRAGSGHATVRIKDNDESRLHLREFGFLYRRWELCKKERRDSSTSDELLVRSWGSAPFCHRRANPGPVSPSSRSP